MKKLILFSFVLLTSIYSQAYDCTKEDITNACDPMVESAKNAADCYKGAKGYAGLSCPDDCKKLLLRCVDKEGVNLKKIWE